MSGRTAAWALLTAVIVLAGPVFAQSPRLDAIWARTNNTQQMTLDGLLNEPAWAVAESMVVNYSQDAGVPGSGWKSEGGVSPSDPTHAVLKFLVVGNQLWMAAKVNDKSIGGSSQFNRFDGFLMSLKDHSVPDQPKPPAEYTYAWWYPTLTDPQPAGQLPAFIGKWATWPPGTPRTQEQVNNWDARTVVNGTSNNDTGQDTGYTVEMRFNLTPMGYDVTRANGDILEWNISVYDTDWFWPLNPTTFSSNRVWWQGPWANDIWYNEVRIYAQPSVNITSGPAPAIPQEIYVYNGGNLQPPVIDGQLTEPVWNNANSFDIRWGDDALRNSYPGIGRYRAGQYQPTVNGHQAEVIDPGDATVKMFFRGNFLYMGFDVRDKYVQYQPSFDRWDGFLVNLNDRAVRGGDNELQGRRLSFQVGADGSAIPQDYLLTLVQAGKASVAISLKPGTVVDTLGITEDTGYWAEMSVDLTALGYPANLGDGVLFIGVDLLDGDSFTTPSDSYGTRTWWYRQYEGVCCPAWAFMDNGTTAVNDPAQPRMAEPALYNFPNPSNRTTVQYQLPAARDVTLSVFDTQGRMVERRPLGIRPAGTLSIPLDGSKWTEGLYFYQLKLVDPASGAMDPAPSGRMVVIR